MNIMIEIIREIESLKSERSFLKSEVDKAEESCDAAKSEVSKITKELASITKQINQIEASLDNERASRHTILKQCKMDGILIPMRKGRLEDIDDDGEDASIEMSSSQPSHIIYEREEKIKIDYSGLNASLQDLEEADDVKKVENTFETQISDLNATIHKILTPNLNGMQQRDEASAQVTEVHEVFRTVRRNLKHVKRYFEQHQSTHDFLGLENPEEPPVKIIVFESLRLGIISILKELNLNTLQFLYIVFEPLPLDIISSLEQLDLKIILFINQKLIRRLNQTNRVNKQLRGRNEQLGHDADINVVNKGSTLRGTTSWKKRAKVKIPPAPSMPSRVGRPISHHILSDIVS